MDNNIIKIDEENLKNDLKGVIRKTIEETLNTMTRKPRSCATRKGMSGQTSAGTTAAVITTASF